MSARLVIALVLVSLAIPSAASGQGRSRLVLVSTTPIAAQFADNEAQFGATIRNASRSDASLAVSLVLETGETIPADGVEHSAGAIRYTLRSAPAQVNVGARAIGQVALTLEASAAAEKAIGGVLVIAAAGTTPATVPVTVAPAAEPKSPFAKARVRPDDVTIVVRRWWPSFVHARGADGDLIRDGVATKVEGVTGGPNDKVTVADVAVVGDTGGGGSITTERKAVDTDGATTFTVDPSDISRRGTYTTTIPLDVSAEASPKLTVKVLAGDHWIWPLLTLLLGAGVAYVIVVNREMVRPTQVLQLALTRAQARSVEADKSDLVKPYTLAGLFPSGAWDCASGERESRPALKLYCEIGAATHQEDLDALALRVKDLEACVAAWPGICAKATALKQAVDRLAQRDYAAKLVAASTKLLEPAPEAVPTDQATADAYAKSIDEQVKAVREWLNADALLEEALRLFKRHSDAPPEHDPARWVPDLRAAESLADLKRCQVVKGLCGDVHFLRTLALPVRRAADAVAYATATGAIEATQELSGEAFEFVSIASPPPALPGPELTTYLVSSIRTTDGVTFFISLAVVTIAYLAGVYSDTYGSIVQYLTAFAAGAGTTFVANWKLLPWYSTFKPPKPAAT